MFNHEPNKYQCPLCGLVKGGNDQQSKQTDIIYHDSEITAFISPKWWNNNLGHVMIIPNNHFENLYDIPEDILNKVNAFAKKVAIALKEKYKCDGTSTRQHNEPAGNQDLWHFHIHVFPRYVNDNLYKLYDYFRWTTPDERLPYVSKLKEYFSK